MTCHRREPQKRGGEIIRAFPSHAALKARAAKQHKDCALAARIVKNERRSYPLSLSFSTLAVIRALLLIVLLAGEADGDRYGEQSHRPPTSSMSAPARQQSRALCLARVCCAVLIRQGSRQMPGADAGGGGGQGCCTAGQQSLDTARSARPPRRVARCANVESSAEMQCKHVSHQKRNKKQSPETRHDSKQSEGKGTATEERKKHRGTDKKQDMHGRPTWPQRRSRGRRQSISATHTRHVVPTWAVWAVWWVVQEGGSGTLGGLWLGLSCGWKRWGRDGRMAQT